MLNGIHHVYFLVPLLDHQANNKGLYILLLVIKIFKRIVQVCCFVAEE
jgi:hypothetical protein